MRQFRLKSAIAAAAMAGGMAAVQAHAGVLTYATSEPPVMDGIYVAASYGDVAGLVDVTHALVDNQGVATATMLWWSTGYDDLAGVGWGGSAAAGDWGRVTLASLGSSLVTLNSFDLGVWSSGRGPDESVSIYEIGQALPVLSFLFNENSDQHHTFNIGLSSNTGFIIEWTSPWWIAIDNLDSSARVAEVVETPEPASAVLLLLGIAGLARMRRHHS